MCHGFKNGIDLSHGISEMHVFGQKRLAHRGPLRAVAGKNKGRTNRLINGDTAIHQRLFGVALITFKIV